MKKFAAVAALLAVCLSTAAAADKKSSPYPRHDVSLGLSPLTVAGFTVKFGSILLNEFSKEELSEEELNLVSDFHNTGAVVVGYSYRLSNIFAIGTTAKLEAGSFIVKDENSGDKESIPFTFDGIHLSLKADWLRMKYFWLYSRLDLGVVYAYVPKVLHHILPSGQLVPLAVEIGKNQMRVYFEAGVGNQGFGTFGLRYRF